jgi:drug/metabolite transporter (DMT)-like permease
LVCGISAGVHAALVPEHWSEERLMGVSFVVAAVALAGCAWLLNRYPRSAWTVRSAAALLVGLIAAYAVTRIGPAARVFGHAEEVDALGVATKAVELIGVGLAVSLNKSGGFR